ncbi:hypothetical protein Efla_006316 [Eimeria flavescens]
MSLRLLSAAAAPAAAAAAAAGPPQRLLLCSKGRLPAVTHIGSHCSRSSNSSSSSSTSTYTRSVAPVTCQQRHSSSSSSGTSSSGTSSSGSSSEYQQQLQHEHDQFAAVASEWWDPKGPMAILHAYTPVRVALLQQQLQTLPIYQDILRQQQQQQQQQQEQQMLPLAGVRIVDVGCGGGLLTEALAAAGATVLGLDANSQLLAAARLRQEQRAAEGLPDLRGRIAFQQADACQPPSPSEAGAAHVVVMSELLEHLWGPHAKSAALAAAAARLQQGGLLLVTTPNRTPENYVASILLAEYVLGLVPKVSYAAS